LHVSSEKRLSSSFSRPSAFSDSIQMKMTSDRNPSFPNGHTVLDPFFTDAFIAIP
jgi:hypothetical protein